MSKWVKDGVSFIEPQEDDYGFTYMVQVIDPQSEYYLYWYIGCKTFFSVTNPRISKKRAEELYKGRGKRPTKEKKIKSSGWQIYNTSNKVLQELTKTMPETSFSWTILDIYKSKSELHLGEAQEILDRGCLCSPNCFNSWISIKVHRSNLECNK